MAEIVRLNDGHLLTTIAKFPSEILAHPPRRCFFLSVAIVKHFFGGQWVEDHLHPDGPPGFLRQYLMDVGTYSEEQTYKVSDLAELLFNLQNVEGFDQCIDRMRQGLIEPTFAELDLGRMLYIADVTFRFVKPQGIKENDYDIEISLPDWPRICADAKCKLEATDFSRNTVKNTLDKARKQFPPDVPSVVFVKVPSQWSHSSPDASRILGEVAVEFLRGTQRVVSVKYYTSLIIWQDGAITHAPGIPRNPKSRQSF